MVISISWTTWVVLSILAVNSSSFAEPDSTYSIPRVGTGRRSQYYVQHSDGTYKYGHDTGEGSFESVKLTANGKIDGEFGYTDDDGQTIHVQYEAGENGFIPRGEHLPAISPDFEAAYASEHVDAGRQYTDPLANPNADASYDFKFTSEGQTRSEQSDSKGNIQGSYRFTDDEGNTRVYTYTAGSGTGFVIEDSDVFPAVQPPNPTLQPSASLVSSISLSPLREGKHHPTTFQSSTSSTTLGDLLYNAPSAVDSQRHPVEQAVVRNYHTADGGHILNYKTTTHERTEFIDQNNKVTGNFAFITEDDGVQRTIQYEASADTGFTVEGDHLPIGPEVPGAPSGRPTGRLMAVHQIPFIDPLANPNSDASYNFNYKSKDGARSEKSNREGTVTGSYSYVDDEGRTRSYTYTAGKGIGFLVKEDDFAPTEVTAEPSIAATRQGNQLYTAPEAAASNVQTSFTSIPSTSISQAPSISSSAANINHATANVVSSNLGSHTLKYKTSTHERTESIDQNNKVIGNFAFVTEDDGVQRTIQYEASADTGFTVEGDHLPIGPEVPGAPSGRPTGRLMAVHQIPFIDPLANPNSDASYNFNYKSKDGARREQSDREGTVVGSYSYVDDEGRTRSYTYTAGKGVGFLVKEVGLAPSEVTAEPSIAATRQRNHLYTAPEAAASNVQPSITSISPTSISTTSSITSAASNINHANANIVSSSLGSHILNYKTPTHERRESIGQNNRVVGNFVFVADDGIRRSIQYEANADTGFTIDGDHLPVGPMVPGSPSGKPNGKLSSVKTTPFIDPLANSDNDPSYNFAFNSEQYSRSETSDSNGNVQGTYTVVDDDGVSRTHSYRAGEGIGFEVQLTDSQIPQSLKGSASSQNFKSVGLNEAYSSGPSAYSVSASNQQPSTFLPTQTSSQQNFNLQQYNAADDPHKFGYVLTFGN